MDPPVIHSYHEYTQHLEEALSFVRCLMHLSRKHAYLVSLDKQMSRCWNTSVNCNVPSDDDREACAKSIGSIRADELSAPIMPTMRAMVPLLKHCQEYFLALPMPEGSVPMEMIACGVDRCRHENPPDAKFCARCGAPLPQRSPASAWQLPSGMVHGEEIIADLRICIDDGNCLERLAPDDELFRLIDEQVLKMARFTRESILPSPQDRAGLKLDGLDVSQMEQHIDAMLASAVQKLHGFSQLYVSFPRSM